MMSTMSDTTSTLSLLHVTDKPQDRDWSEGFPEEWDYLAADHCDECGAIVVGGFEADCEECGHLQDVSEGPMMNYYYPCEIEDITEAARRLVDLPLCVVYEDERDGWTGLALTGGGMDLSWEIAYAYVLLGYVPPLHFADLPSMAGGSSIGSEGERAVLNAYDRALTWQENDARSMRERHARLRDSIV